MEQERQIPEPRLAPALDALGHEFLVDILSIEVARHPGNLAALTDLGHAYTRTRQFEKGLEIDRELVRRTPTDPTVHYNLACSLALLGSQAEALDALERAIALGYEDLAHMVADEDLASLREEARFQEFLRTLGA